MDKGKVKDIKFVIFFVIVFSICSVFLFQSSYAKYRKKVDADVNMDIAKWNIKINDEDINNKATLSKMIVPQFEQSENTNSNVIAPGTSGYCDIVIDSANVDVSFNYEIDAIIPKESAIKDLIITDYVINPVATSTKIKFPDNNKITGNIKFNTPKTVIRLFILWNDDVNNQMDNLEDTKVAIDPNSKALIDISLKFSQQNKK